MTSAADPVIDATLFRRHVQRISADGATLLLSSHILSEVEQLCGRVTIIRSGGAVESGTLAELRHLKLTHFRIVGGADAVLLTALPWVQGVLTDGDVVEFDVDAADLAPVLEAVAVAGISGLSVSPPSLESLFLSHYGWCLFAALLGGIAGGSGRWSGDVIGGNESLRELILRLVPGSRAEIIDVFTAALLGIAGVPAAAAGIQAVLRLRAEEAEGRAELLLATPRS